MVNGVWGMWKSSMLKLVDIVEHAAETHLDYIAIWHQGSAADERYASPLVQKYCLIHQTTKHIVLNKLTL